MSSPTRRRLIEPGHRSLHRLVHRLEERNANDASAADHQRLERDVIQPERLVLHQGTSIERLDEADTQYAQVASRVQAGLDVERPLRVDVVYICGE